jgi:hypothetical protein
MQCVSVTDSFGVSVSVFIVALRDSFDREQSGTFPRLAHFRVVRFHPIILLVRNVNPRHARVGLTNVNLTVAFSEICRPRPRFLGSFAYCLGITRETFDVCAIAVLVRLRTSGGTFSESSNVLICGRFAFRRRSIVFTHPDYRGFIRAARFATFRAGFILYLRVPMKFRAWWRGGQHEFCADVRVVDFVTRPFHLRTLDNPSIDGREQITTIISRVSHVKQISRVEKRFLNVPQR